MTLQFFLLLSIFLPSLLDNLRSGARSVAWELLFFDDFLACLKMAAGHFLIFPPLDASSCVISLPFFFSSCLYTYLIHYNVYHLSFILPLAIDEHFFHIRLFNLVHSLIILAKYIYISPLGKQSQEQSEVEVEYSIPSSYKVFKYESISCSFECYITCNPMIPRLRQRSDKTEKLICMMKARWIDGWMDRQGNLHCGESTG